MKMQARFNPPMVFSRLGVDRQRRSGRLKDNEGGALKDHVDGVNERFVVLGVVLSDSCRRRLWLVPLDLQSLAKGKTAFSDGFARETS